MIRNAIENHLEWSVSVFVLAFIVMIVVSVEFAVGRRLNAHVKQIKGLFAQALMSSQGYEGMMAVVRTEQTKQADHITTLTEVSALNHGRIDDHETRLKLLEGNDPVWKGT